MQLDFNHIFMDFYQKYPIFDRIFQSMVILKQRKRIARLSPWFM